MYPVSAQWENTLKHSHTALAQVDITVSGTTASFPVMSGTIVQDYDDPTRWGFDLTIVDAEQRDYEEMRSLVNPFLARIVPRAGVRHADGTTELVPCGEMFVKDLEVAETEGGAVSWRLNSFDASTRLQSPLAAPFVIPGGVDPTSVVPQLLTPRFPPLTVQVAKTRYTTQPMILRERGLPWSEARKLVGSVGLDLSVDRSGVGVMLARVIDASDVRQAVWTFDEDDRADFTQPARKSTLDDRPNVVVVTGTHPNASNVTGIAFDNDPRSPTYRYSPDYGEVTWQEESDRVFTNPQATDMAQWILSKKLGPQDQVTFLAICNPALDVGDVVLVNRARIGLVYEPMIVTHLELPLVVTDFMQVTCRRSIFSNASDTPVRP